MTTARGEALRMRSAGSEDKIRIRDLWLMSQPVAVSQIAVGLIRSGQRCSAIQPVSPRRACSHRIHHVLFPNPFPTQQLSSGFAMRPVAPKGSWTRGYGTAPPVLTPCRGDKTPVHITASTSPASDASDESARSARVAGVAEGTRECSSMPAKGRPWTAVYPPSAQRALALSMLQLRCACGVTRNFSPVARLT